MKSKKIVTILSIFAVIITVIGGTLAYWSWSTSEEQRTLVTFSVADNFSCSVDGGGNITSATYTVAPASCTNSTYAIKREVTTTVEVTGNEPVTMDLVININNLGTGLTNSENFMYALTEDSSSCSNNVISQGTFNGKTNGNTISILNKTYEETTTETYYLWIWLDAVETSSTTKEQPFNLSLGGTCTDTPMDYFYAVYVSDGDYKLYFVDQEESEIREIYDNPEYDKSIIDLNKIYVNAVYTENNLPPWHEYASNIYMVSIEDEISPTNTQYWFYGFDSDCRMYLGNLNTSNVTSMAYMFSEISGDFEPNGLSNWNTSNVKDMSGMFYEAGDSSFNLGDISGWNTSNVMNMNSMFAYAGESTTVNLDLSNWNVGKVRDMNSMFYSTGDDVNVGNLDNWDVSNVTDMGSMFEYVGDGGTSFNIGNLSGWITSKVTNMSYMFSGVGTESEIFDIGNLDDWDVSKVTNMSSMFSSACGMAATCDIGNLSNWNTSNVTNIGSMFADFGYNDKNLDISFINNWDVFNVTNMSYMFSNFGKNIINFSLDLSDWDTSSVKSVNSMFANTGYNSSSFEIIGLDNFNTKNVTNMQQMFYYTGYGADTFNIGDIGGWNTGKVTNMNNMFQNAGFTDSDWSLNLSAWNVSNVNYYNGFNSGSSTKVTLPLAWQS